MSKNNYGVLVILFGVFGQLSGANAEMLGSYRIDTFSLDCTDNTGDCTVAIPPAELAQCETWGYVDIITADIPSNALIVSFVFSGIAYSVNVKSSTNIPNFYSGSAYPTWKLYRVQNQNTFPSIDDSITHTDPTVFPDYPDQHEYTYDHWVGETVPSRLAICAQNIGYLVDSENRLDTVDLWYQYNEFPNISFTVTNGTLIDQVNIGWSIDNTAPLGTTRDIDSIHISKRAENTDDNFTLITQQDPESETYIDTDIQADYHYQYKLEICDSNEFCEISAIEIGSAKHAYIDELNAPTDGFAMGRFVPIIVGDIFVPIILNDWQVVDLIDASGGQHVEADGLITNIYYEWQFFIPETGNYKLEGLWVNDGTNTTSAKFVLIGDNQTESFLVDLSQISGAGDLIDVTENNIALTQGNYKLRIYTDGVGGKVIADKIVVTQTN